jgi:sigma-E factor negative regulatory protein RseC
MHPSGNIEHKGIVTELEGNKAKVTILAESACSSCHAKGVCGASEMQDKIIEVNTQNALYNIGEQVNVVLKKSEGYKALFYGYILPLLVLLITLIITQNIFEKELIAGLLSIGILIPYYFVLYLLRDKLKQSFHFVLQKLETNI